jgi:predicted nucleotidyltransferase
MSALVALAGELGTTDRTLRRGIEGGWVRASRPSPRKLEIGPDERVYLRNYWGTLSDLRDVLRTEPSVGAAVLFGSMARGDAHGQSDIDLLVDLRATSPGVRLGVRRRLEEATGRSVQLLPLRAAKNSPLLFAEILKEGRPLVDRERLWPSLQLMRSSVERAAKLEARARAARLADLASPKAA